MPHDTEEKQIDFEMTVHALISNAEALTKLDRSSNLNVDSVSETSLSNAVTHINAFILKHRRVVAA